jgi:hypothetical protein
VRGSGHNRATVRATSCMALCLCSVTSWGGPDVMTTPEAEALARDFRIVKMVALDVDGDGAPEPVLVFQDPGNGGGLLVMKSGGSSYRQVACVYLEGHAPLDATLDGKDLAVTLERADRPLLLTPGRELAWRGGEGDPFARTRVSATSSLPGGAHGPGQAWDQDLSTSWAEGKDGTGIGEALVLEWPRPVAVGLLGIFSGAGPTAKEFKEANRMRRGVVEVRTTSDVGDDGANIDFADLGIASSGRKVEVSFGNKPEFRFARVTEEDVVKLTLRVESVYLGDRRDDTHVTEVSLCQLLADSRVRHMLQRKKPAKTP